MNLSICRPKENKPNVLTCDVLTRIRLMNEVARDLKKQGISLGQQELYPLRWQSRPSIEINRKRSISIMSVICKAELTWHDEGIGYAVYRGVTVWWSCK